MIAENVMAKICPRFSAIASTHCLNMKTKVIGEFDSDQEPVGNWFNDYMSPKNIPFR